MLALHGIKQALLGQRQLPAYTFSGEQKTDTVFKKPIPCPEAPAWVNDNDGWNKLWTRSFHLGTMRSQYLVETCRFVLPAFKS